MCWNTLEGRLRMLVMVLVAILGVSCMDEPDPGSPTPDQTPGTPPVELTPTPLRATPTLEPTLPPTVTPYLTPTPTPGLSPTPGPTETPWTPWVPTPTATLSPTETPTAPPTPSPIPLTPTVAPTDYPTDSVTGTPRLDGDGDGYTPGEGDCDDTDPLTHPGAEEIPYDGIDQSCDGLDLVDVDQDGYVGSAAGGDDCDDLVSSTYPGAVEYADGQDNDCDGLVDEDLDTTDDDKDLFAESQGDCDDSDATIYPGAEEVPYDGIDQDCDGLDLSDMDEDGFAGGSDGSDCDDLDPDVHPEADEIPYDSIDQDCDGSDLVDVDGDGYTASGSGGTDCADQDASVHPMAIEVCDGKDNNCDGTTDVNPTDGTIYYVDTDGDGYGVSSQTFHACQPTSNGTLVSGDCNDSAADIHPGALEICNQADDDCNGLTDEGVTSLFYRDADGDGFGDASSTTTACSVPQGYVSSTGDCDDKASGVNPGATEQCNGIDDDCDGLKDEGVATIFYRDEDGDGFGLASSTTTACSAPAGYVAAPGDCDDKNGAVSPAATEVCNGADDDCDGIQDDGVLITYYLDADSDGYGVTSSTVQACSRPAGFSAVPGDCNDASPAIHPGAAEVCNGQDDDCDGLKDSGLTATWYRDVDGDGYGVGSSTTQACTAPPGYAGAAGDCNDNVAAVNPGATELCNAVDDDCDGVADEGVTLIFYRDVDGDGYGISSSVTQACTTPAGYSSKPGDCDDSAAAVHPNATEICNSVDDDCDGVKDEGVTTTWYRDADGDGYGTASSTIQACAGSSGYSAVSGDCNDTSSSVNPGATEACNGLDDDCDGTFDEGVQLTWYRDADGDGYGVVGMSTLACTAPNGYVSKSGDCDDTAAAVNPGATEACNGIDDDCDSVKDEGVLTTWYRDADGDGYGLSVNTTQACTAPSGYVAQAGDCDDSKASVHPGATEVCNTLDDDCDGQTDEGVQTTWYRDGDGDGYGISSSTVAACSAPTGFASKAGDCDDSVATIYPGATEVCNGLDDDCDGSKDEGVLSTFYRDGDGDGYGVSSSSTQACAAPSGYSSQSGDCDDTLSSVHPNAKEICNGVDDDCDGSKDEGVLTTYYRDADGDGYGLSSSVTQACSQPGGYASVPGDCNDASAAIHPGVTDDCDSLDNDCDGAIDEDCAPPMTCYRDADADGYGNPAITTVASVCPAGYVSQGGDCNDSNAAVNPGATELCDTSGTVDEDCDGLVDDGDPSTLGSSKKTWYPDSDKDGYGAASAGVTACKGSIGTITTGGDCNDNDATVHPGQKEICFNGKDDDCDVSTSDTGCSSQGHCGTISASETWKADVVHNVTCDVLVQGSSSPILTIEDGAMVRFAVGTGLAVARSNYGSLVVKGTSSGVLFTSASSSPLPGDWDGLEIGASDRGTTLTGLTLEYGGYNTYGGIYLVSSSPRITGSIIQRNKKAGIWAISGAAPYISSTDIINNEGYGYYGVTAGLGRDGGVTFANNVVSGNTSYPVTILANYADELDPSSTFKGNGTDAIVLAATTVTADGTWLAQDVPYRVDGRVGVQASSSPILSLADGAVLQFATGAELAVGATNYGKLLVNGSSLGVVMTSGASSPSAGDWKGLSFGPYDQGSSLAGLKLSYGGGNGFGAIYATSANLKLTSCQVTFSSKDGVYASSSKLAIASSTFADNREEGIYLDSSSSLSTVNAPSFVGNTLTGNGNYPIVLPPDSLGQLASGNTISGNARDYVRVLGGTVSSSATWRAQTVPYNLSADVMIQASSVPVVTISGGATFKADTGAGLIVAASNYGKLVVAGSSQPVVFTSISSSPAPGDWKGISLQAYDQGSDLTGLEVFYGGGNGFGGIYATSASIKLNGCKVSTSSKNGVYASSATLAVSNSTFASNLEDGLYLDSSSQLSTSGTPSFANNTLTGNTGYAMTLPPESMGQLASSTKIASNGKIYVRVLGGTASSSATWRALPVSYNLVADVGIQGSGSPVVTIEDGTSFRFSTGAALGIGRSNYGKLVVNGNQSGVLMTSLSSSPAAGDWKGLTFGPYDQKSELTNLQVSYGGGNGYAGIFVQSATVKLNGCKVTDSSKHGVYLTSGVLTSSGSTFSNNTEDGIYLDSSSQISTANTPSFASNTLSGNGGYAMTLMPESVGQLASSNTISGNGKVYIRVMGGSVTSSATWRAQSVPFYVVGDVYLQGSGSPVVTFADGVILRFATGIGLSIGSSNYGRLIVSGSSSGVLLTSASSAPAGGDWKGVTVGPYDQGSELTGLEVAYAGGNGFGGIYLQSSRVKLVGCSLHDSSKYGLYAASATLSASGSSFSNNVEDGVYLDSSSQLLVASSPSFAGNTLSGNTGYPITLPPESIGQLAGSNAMSKNGKVFVRVLAGTVANSATWRAQPVPYNLVGTTYFQGSSSPLVVIEDGASFKVNIGAALYVGWSNYGGLTVQGSTQGVLMESSSGLPAAGDWLGILLGPYSSASSNVLEGMTVRHAGRSGYAGIYMNAGSSKLTLNHCTLESNSNAGLLLEAGTALITSSLFKGNTGYGVSISSSGRLATGTGATFKNNVLTANTVAPLGLPADSVGQVDKSSTFTGNVNDVVLIRSGTTVSASATWQGIGVPYRTEGTLYVQGSTTPQLTLEDGVSLLFPRSAGLYVGWSNYGTLVAKGTSQGILFSSMAATKAPGDWLGMYLGPYANVSVKPTLDRVTVEYGGASGLGNVIFYSGGSITNSTVQFSSSWGIYRSGGTPTISNITYQGNVSGDLK